MSDNWEERKRPTRLERRYEFQNYTELRDYLDEAAEISEKYDYYPNMGFGKDYVNITIYADETDGLLTDVQRKFASALDDHFFLINK